jgi:transcriptional regulator with XRE-family HTH domain
MVIADGPDPDPDRVTDPARDPGQGRAARLAFGDLLRVLRRRADLSQRELAARAGVPRSTVGRLESESGMDARLGTVERVLGALDGRLAVIDAAGVEVLPEPDDPELRDAADRRFPARLDVRPVIEAVDWWGNWWAHWYEIPRDRWPTAPPAYTFDLGRRLRDVRRSWPPDPVDPGSTR